MVRRTQGQIWIAFILELWGDMKKGGDTMSASNRNGTVTAMSKGSRKGCEQRTLGSVTPLVWTKMTLCMNLIAANLTPAGVC